MRTRAPPCTDVRSISLLLFGTVLGIILYFALHTHTVHVHPSTGWIEVAHDQLHEARGGLGPPSQVKRVLITGAAGFVGFHTASWIAANEAESFVVGLDLFNEYYDIRLKQEREQILATKHNVEVVHGDVCDRTLVADMLRNHRITHVLHLAAQAGVRYSLEHPLEYVRENVHCFVDLLEVLRDFEDVKLVYASSSSVYGLNQKVPFAETDPVNQPASLYAATKRSDELIAHVYNNLYGRRSIGLRFFTVYGPIGRPDMAYFSFTKAIVAGEPIKAYNQGKVSRDFTYIDDLVPGVVAALDLDDYNLELFNLGSNKPFTVMELISCVEDALDMKANVQFTDRAKGDVDKTFADLTHSHHKLGYMPSMPLCDGINRFVSWYASFYNVTL
eukprot:CAMPEP_0170750280 /NCGR_PEP_ID=MMETSP0437-20130122/10844_1 /TAXON_ID=0 /ORGANISM="Sexangularia sp." /LENGTH=387 /DNA_ID=CAMNT_0011089259 /DNA_START=46 /DNA_END=1206 /DNA_ORIENTATION=-